MPQVKQRICEIDLLKGLAILIVSIRHINELTGLAEKGGITATVFAMFTEGIMALFFICSGYVYKSKGKVSVDLLNRMKRLFIPLLCYSCFNTAVYFVKYILIDKMPFVEFIDNTLANFLGFDAYNIRTGTLFSNGMKYSFIPYWFVMQMISTYLIFIPIHELVEKRRSWVKMTVAGTLFLLSFLCNKFDVQHVLENTFKSPVSKYFVLINIFGFAGLLLLGSILRDFDFFDIESNTKATRIISFCISLTVTIIIFATYNRAHYAFLWGRWGQFDEWSVPLTALGGLAITYLGICAFHYLGKIKAVFTVFNFMGVHSFDILMPHMMIAEIILWISGTWYPVFDNPYPVESFSWLNWFTIVIIDAIAVAIYIFAKDKIK